MPKVLMTFDLEGAEDDDYERGYDALLACGLSRVSENKQIRLPRSSVFGAIDIGKKAEEISNVLRSTLEEATGKKVERIFVAVVDDWACFGYPDEKLGLKELITRFAILRQQLEQ